MPLDPRDPKSPRLPCVAIQLGRTKTGDAHEAGRVLLVGPPAEYLREWLQRADISRGPVFGYLTEAARQGIALPEAMQ